MAHTLGALIARYRRSLNLTQDQFAARYHKSGPAIFKFEKGVVRPSLEAWLAIARDMGMTDAHAVIVWIQEKLPAKYQGLLAPREPARVHASKPARRRASAGMDYVKITDRDTLRRTVLQDASVPAELRAVLSNDDVWRQFQPTGEEISLLRDCIVPCYSSPSCGGRIAPLIPSFSIFSYRFLRLMAPWRAAAETLPPARFSRSVMYWRSKASLASAYVRFA